MEPLWYRGRGGRSNPNHSLQGRPLGTTAALIRLWRVAAP